MPLYEYECESCSLRFERIVKFSDPPLETCPSCSGKVRKLLSSPAIQFKGTGWYITDYAKKSSGESGKGSAGKSDGRSEAKSAESSSDKSDKSDKSDSSSASPAQPAAKSDTKGDTK